MGRATTCEPRRPGREVDFDQIGDENARDVGAICRRCHVRSEDERVDEGRELRSHRVLAEQDRVHLGRRSAVEILVLDRHQALVEERIALARDLNKVTESEAGRGPENLDATPAGRRVDPDDLPFAADLVERNIEHHRVDVEASL